MLAWQNMRSHSEPVSHTLSRRSLAALFTNEFRCVEPGGSATHFQELEDLKPGARTRPDSLGLEARPPNPG